VHFFALVGIFSSKPVAEIIFTSSGYWHAARNLTAFYNVMDSNQLSLEISVDMPFGPIDTLAESQLAIIKP
jgi:hypothetical protein